MILCDCITIQIVNDVKAKQPNRYSCEQEYLPILFKQIAFM